MAWAVLTRSSMASSKAPGGDAAGATPLASERAQQTLPCDAEAQQQIYLECVEQARLPEDLVRLFDGARADLGLTSALGAEHTLLAGSIAPEQRKVGPSVEVKELGRGGIGRVYVSIDMGLQREIAIKEILPDLLEGDADAVQALRARFLREARVTGQLEHPNIVPVYEVGQRDDGSLYYSMRLIRGRTLKEAVDSAKTLPERLAFLNHFLGLCHAIAYAHSRGVIHRDIKPQNVMLGEFGETVVLDWGVAKLAQVEETGPVASAIREPTSELPEQTRVGQVLGTPAYMAPEALLGQAERVDARSDVWSLGVVLYVLLSGELPFRGGLARLVARAMSGDAWVPAPLDPLIPPELRAIAARALLPEPERRYQSAREMAADVEAYLTGAKVGAYAYSSWELARRFYARHRSSVLVALAGLLAMLVLSVVGYRRVLEARDRALALEHEQRLSAEQARERLAQLLAESSGFALGEGDTARAELLAARALVISERADARSVIASLGPRGQPRLVQEREYRQHCDRLARAARVGSLGCASGRKLFLLERGKLRLLGEAERELSALALTADAGVVFSGDQTGRLTRWSSVSPQEKTQIEVAKQPLSALALSADDQELLLGFADGRAERRRVRDLELVAEYQLGEAVSVLELSVHGALAVGGRMGALKLWRPGASTPLQFQGHHGTLTALGFSPDGFSLATGSSDRNVRIWQSQRPEQHPLIVGRGSVAQTFAWSKSGEHLIYGTGEHSVYWVDVRLGRSISKLPGHTQAVLAVALGADEKSLVSVDSQLRQRSWQIPEERWHERLVERGNVLALAGGAPRAELISGGLGEHGLCVWDLERNRCATRLPFRAAEVRALALTRNGKLLATAGKGGELLVWDLEQRLPLVPLFGHRADVRALGFSGDQQHLFSGDLDGKLVRWQLASAKQLRVRELGSGLNALAVSPDASRLAVATRRGSIEIWDSRLERKQATLVGHEDWVMGVVFLTPTELASAGADSSVRLWNLSERRQVGLFKAGSGRVLTLDVAPNGKFLAAAGEDRVVRMWNLESRKLALSLRGHEAAVRGLEFLGPERLASASDDRSIHLWRLDVLEQSPQQILREAEARYGVRSETVGPEE